MAPSNSKDNSLVKFIIKLDSLGNTPYFSQSIVEELKKYFISNNTDFTEDEFALYVKVGNQSLPPIIVDTHLDHPGFVIKEDNTVHSLGSFVRSKMINKISFPEKLPVGFYASTGHFITSGFLYKLALSGGQITAHYQTNRNIKLPTNTQVMPLLSTGLQKDKLNLRSVDNLATVFVCLNLINDLKNRDDLNTTFIFAKLEEIYQFSSTGIARRGSTPFERINNNTPIIVLEVAPLLSESQSKNGDLAVAVTENKINTISEDSEIFKQLKQSCRSLGINLHYTNLLSHGNSIVYKLVAKNNQTICLHAGSFNRHNIDDQGNFTAEFVYLKSLLNLASLTKLLIENLTKNYPKIIQSTKLTKIEKQKTKQLAISFIRAYPRLKFNKLYPNSLLEYIYFAYYSSIAKFYSLLRWNHE